MFPVTAPEAGLRLDRLLTARCPEQSRSGIAKAIAAGAVLVDGVVKKAAYRVRSGEQVMLTGAFGIAGTLFQGAEEDEKLLAEPIDFPILYEDEYLLFLNKPPGLVVHPGSGNSCGTLANALLHHNAEFAGVGDSMRPGIVHRLDKDTSGVMVAAKTPAVHRSLTAMFAEHNLQKIYYAIVCGRPKSGAQGRIIGSIGRHPKKRQKMAVLERGGRFAATNWCCLEDVTSQKMGQYSLFELDIETGRTHQIRVHLAHIGYPVAGDLLYGGKSGQRNPELFPRQMLHASRLTLSHPVTGENLVMEAPLWKDFQQTLVRLRENREEEKRESGR